MLKDVSLLRRLKPDAKSKLKWRTSPVFVIKLHIKDIAILEAIKNTLGVGTVTTDRLNMANFNVWSVKELQVIIDHFDKYPLLSQKCADYQLFKDAITLIKNKEHLSSKGIKKILGIRASMNLGLSDELKLSFPDIQFVSRPLVGL